jgi:hypothetical protein
VLERSIPPYCTTARSSRSNLSAPQESARSRSMSMTVSRLTQVPETIRQQESFGTPSNPKAWVMQEFKNSSTTRLGIPLPRGRVRFCRHDDDGQLAFTGEGEIDHTLKDETIRLYTGNVAVCGTRLTRWLGRLARVSKRGFVIIRPRPSNRGLLNTFTVGPSGKVSLIRIPSGKSTAGPWSSPRKSRPAASKASTTKLTIAGSRRSTLSGCGERSYQWFREILER